MATEKNFKVDTGVTTPSIATATGDFQWSANVTGFVSNSGPTETIVSLDTNLFGDPYSGQITIQDVAQPTELNGTWYYQAADTNKVSLYSDASLTTPVDSSSWQPYTSGGFVYTVGYTELVINASSVSITSEKGDAGTYLWNFGIDGNLSVPGNIVVSQSIVSSPSPYINGFSSANFGLFVTADEVRLSNNAVGTAGGTSNLELNAQHGFASDSYIQLPTFADGGEKLIIKNEYASGNGIDVITGGGNWFFSDNGNLDTPGNITINGKQGFWAYNSVGLTVTANVENDVNGMSMEDGADTYVYAGAHLILESNINGTFNNWTFDNAGNLSLPGNIVSSSDIGILNNISNTVNGTNESGTPGVSGTQTFNAALVSNPGLDEVEVGWLVTGNNLNGTTYVTSVAESPPGFFTITTNTTAETPFWYNDVYVFTKRIGFTFTSTGNLTLPGNTFSVNYANGSAVSLGGSYGNSNVATFLASYGSNTISTTGNVNVGNLVGAYANGNSNINIPAANGNVNISAVGNANIVVVTGTGANITGTLNVSSNIVTGGNINSSSFSGGNISWTANNRTDFQGSIKLGGSGQLLSPGGAASLTLDNNGFSASQANLSSKLNLTGNANISGVTATGIGAINAGNYTAQLANTIASFTTNVNSYTQVTNQNKSTGADATADYILTADNGSDTVNYGDFGIINSGYDANTPTNSLGNIVFAADTYMYAQGNTGNASQSGGNLAIGTTVPGKNVKIFAGGVDNTAIVANIANTGITITGNLNVSGNITGNTGGFAIGYRDIPQVAASNTTLASTDGGKHYYSTTAGNFTLTIPNNATTSFATGTAISIVVQAAGNILVNAAAGVTLYMAGNSTGANRVVGTYGMATLMKVASDTWFINGTGVS